MLSQRACVESRSERTFWHKKRCLRAALSRGSLSLDLVAHHPIDIPLYQPPIRLSIAASIACPSSIRRQVSRLIDPETHATSSLPPVATAVGQLPPDLSAGHLALDARRPAWSWVTSLIEKTSERIHPCATTMGQALSHSMHQSPAPLRMDWTFLMPSWHVSGAVELPYSEAARSASTYNSDVRLDLQSRAPTRRPVHASGARRVSAPEHVLDISVVAVERWSVSPTPASQISAASCHLTSNTAKRSF